MPPTAPETRLVVFAKAPAPGAVKTRLIPALGAAGAAALHRRLVLHTLRTAATAGLGEPRLYCAPTVEDAFFRHCRDRHGVALHAQGDGDLGARMRQAFTAQLGQAGAVVLVGTDSPALAADRLAGARDALCAGADAVFVPAEDGGYALIGLRQVDARLFDAMPWSTGAVMAATRKRLRALGWRWHELPPVWDVDRPSDYERLCAEGWLDVLPE